MSVLEWRGGFPVVFGGTVATTGIVTDDRGNAYVANDGIVLGAHQVQLEQDGRKSTLGASKWLEVRNLDATNAVRIYFAFDHFSEDIHYITLQGGATEFSKFTGPGEIKRIWLRAVVGTPRVEIVAFNRRG